MTDPKEPTSIEVTQPAPLAAPAPLAGTVELEDSFADATLEMDESGTKFRVGSVAGVEGVLKDPQVADKIKTTSGSVAISPTAPVAGQVLTASGPTGASWAEPAAAGGGATGVVDGQLLTGPETGVLVAGKDPANNAQFLATETTGALRISDGGGSVTVDGSVGLTGAVPLPTGAATEATLQRINTQGQKAMAASTPVVIASDQSAVAVSGTVGVSGTVPISAAAPLPVSDNSGSLTVDTPQLPASLGAKTSALSTSVVLASDHAAQAVTAAQLPASLGSKTSAASLPVVIASDQAAVAVSGTVTANNAALTDGTQKAIARGGAKGATTAADITGTAEGTDHQALDVQLYHGGAAKDPTQIRALTSSDVVTANIGTAGTLALDATLTARLPASVGQKTGAGSLSVVLASDQAAQSVNGTVTATQGTPAALSAPWPVKLTDGTNVMPTGDVVARAVFHKITDGSNGTAAVKPASTAAVTTDTALVVAIHPASNANKVTDGTNTMAVKAASTAAGAADPSAVVAISPNSNTVKPAVPTTAYSGQFSVNAGAASKKVYADGGAGSGATLQSGVEVRCDQDSPGHLIIRAGGTAGTDYATSGYRVYQGQAVFLPISSLDGFVVQGSVASSKGSYIAS